MDRDSRTRVTHVSVQDMKMFLEHEGAKTGNRVPCSLSGQ